MNPYDLNLIAKRKRMLNDDGRFQQVATLVWRSYQGQLQVMLITSRGTGRWVLPKGWPQKGYTFAQTAAREAFEEAGVNGELDPIVFGSYEYEKDDMDEDDISVFTVYVYPLKFLQQSEDWPEKDQRIVEWFSPRKAASLVHEADLRTLILRFSATYKADS